MKKALKELTVLIILPLILTSVSLAVIGTSHSSIMAHTSQIIKLRHESNDKSSPCEVGLCQSIQNLEHNFIEFEKDFQKDISI